jgi:hypothetical protein
MLRVRIFNSLNPTRRNMNEKYVTYPALYTTLKTHTTDQHGPHDRTQGKAGKNKQTNN